MNNDMHRCQYDPFPHRHAECGALSRSGMTNEAAIAYAEEMLAKGFCAEVFPIGAERGDAGAAVGGGK